MQIWAKKIQLGRVIGVKQFECSDLNKAWVDANDGVDPVKNQGEWVSVEEIKPEGENHE